MMPRAEVERLEGRHVATLYRVEEYVNRTKQFLTIDCKYGGGSMIVIKTSIFPASKEEVFNKLQRLKLLQYIAWPYATFTPVGEKISEWRAGTSSVYMFKLFGIIPFGTHKINVVSFDKDDGIYTHEGNEYVPTWNHRIVLEEISPDQCLYSDIVEIEAGWKTIFVYLWARCFYAHRQRKWIRLLSKGTKS